MRDILEFEFRGVKYLTERFTAGKMVDVWKMRSILTMGTYGQIYRMALNDADESLLVVDIEVFLNVLCPKFVEDMKVKSVRDLGIQDYIELKEFYKTTLLPWLKEIENIVSQKEKISE